MDIFYPLYRYIKTICHAYCASIFASHVCRECNALSVLEDARYGRDGTKHAISHPMGANDTVAFQKLTLNHLQAVITFVFGAYAPNNNHPLCAIRAS